MLVEGRNEVLGYLAPYPLVDDLEAHRDSTSGSLGMDDDWRWARLYVRASESRVRTRMRVCIPTHLSIPNVSCISPIVRPGYRPTYWVLPEVHAVSSQPPLVRHSLPVEAAAGCSCVRVRVRVRVRGRAGARPLPIG